ncbi:MAG: hypothetical protein QMB52_00045 [Propionivibrio sp.]
MMDRETRRVLLCLGLMMTVCLATIAVIRRDGAPRERRLLVLDAVGGEGARRLGLTTSPVEHSVCEVEAEAAQGLRWVTIGTVDIRAEHLIAVREAGPPSPDAAIQQQREQQQPLKEHA